MDNRAWLDAVPVGWRSILHDAIEKLHAIDPETRIIHAKEKLGTLRVQIDRSSAETDAVIADAMVAARAACEICGTAAILRSRDGYYSTRCREHAAGFVVVDAAPNVTLRIPGYKA